MCFIFHEWTKWTQYDKTYAFFMFPDSSPRKVTDTRQWRVCKKCGAMQDVLVAENTCAKDRGEG